METGSSKGTHAEFESLRSATRCERDPELQKRLLVEIDAYEKSFKASSKRSVGTLFVPTRYGVCDVRRRGQNKERFAHPTTR